MLRSSMISFVLFLSLFASAASPERSVGDAVATPATLLRYLPAAASNGREFFVVWNDGRSGTTSIIGTRVSRDGDVLDPYGIRIASAGQLMSAPRAVWDGDHYLVAWTGADSDENINVYAARINEDGAMTMPPRLIAADATTDEGNFIASNGTVSVIAYRSDGLKVAVLDRNGNTLHHEAVSDGSEYTKDASVAAGTSRFVVAWNENPGFTPSGEMIKAAALTTAGYRIDPPKTVLAGEEPAVASNGSHFTIVSLENNDWHDFSLRSRTFDGNLNPIGGEQSLLTDASVARPSIVWLTGNRFEVFAVRKSMGGVPQLVSIDLDANGAPLQPQARVRVGLYADPYWVHMFPASNGNDVLVAHTSDYYYFNKQIVAQLYRDNATTAEVTKPLAWSGNVHREPTIVSSASGHFIAWAEDDGMFATRVDLGGNSLDGRGIRLTSSPRQYNDRAAVAFDGANYVVAWRDTGFIGIRKISPLTGATVAESQVAVNARTNLALVASADATYLAYNDGRIRVARIPHNTHTPDPAPLAVSPETMEVGAVAAAWNGSTLLMSWTEDHHFSWADPPFTLSVKVYAARVNASLALLDPAPLLIATTPDDEYKTFGIPSVASNGADWLVVTDYDYEDILARRVLQNGTVEGDAPVKIGDGEYAVATWDGERYAVAWKEGKTGSAERPLILSAIQPTGELRTSHRVFVSAATASGWPWTLPSVTSTGNGETVVAYPKVSYRPEHGGVPRTFFRVLNLGATRGRVVRR